MGPKMDFVSNLHADERCEPLSCREMLLSINQLCSHNHAEIQP